MVLQNNFILLFWFILILRALILFFTILPISNTGSSAAGISTIVQFLYTKLGSFFDNGVQLLATCLLGLEGPQVLCRTKYSLSFWQQTKRPHYTHNIKFSSKRNVLATHQNVWAVRSCTRANLAQREGHPPLIFLPYTIF